MILEGADSVENYRALALKSVLGVYAAVQSFEVKLWAKCERHDTATTPQLYHINIK